MRDHRDANDVNYVKASPHSTLQQGRQLSFVGPLVVLTKELVNAIERKREVHEKR